MPVRREMTGLMKTYSSFTAVGSPLGLTTKEPVREVDLIGGQPDPLGGVHQIEHLADDAFYFRVHAAEVFRFAAEGGVRVFDDPHG